MSNSTDNEDKPYAGLKSMLLGGAAVGAIGGGIIGSNIRAVDEKFADKQATEHFVDSTKAVLVNYNKVLDPLTSTELDRVEKQAAVAKALVPLQNSFRKLSAAETEVQNQTSLEAAETYQSDLIKSGVIGAGIGAGVGVTAAAAGAGLAIATGNAIGALATGGRKRRSIKPDQVNTDKNNDRGIS